MRTPFALAAIAIILSIANGARAQESDQPLNAETAARLQLQRTPAMVYEIITPPQSQKNLPRPQGQATLYSTASPNAALDTAAVKKSALPSLSIPAPMIVLQAHAFDQPAPFDIWSTGNVKYDELIMKASARHGVDPNLIVSMMKQESGFNPRARSYKGAAGLMQLMPGTARRFGVGNVYDPAESIEGGTKYLRFLLDQFDGDVELALAGYNAGENAVINSGYKVPRYRETRNYVKNISATYGSKKHQVGAARPAGGQVAPAPVAVSKGSSRGLSNNY